MNNSSVSVSEYLLTFYSTEFIVKHMEKFIIYFKQKFTLVNGGGRPNWSLVLVIENQVVIILSNKLIEGRGSS